MRFTAEVRGVDRARTKWRGFLGELSIELARLALEAAEEGAKAARANHLFENRTHDLEEAIGAEPGPRTRRGGKALIVARTFYASFVERHDGVGGYMKAAMLVARQHLLREMVRLRGRARAMFR